MEARPPPGPPAITLTIIARADVITTVTAIITTVTAIITTVTAIITTVTAIITVTVIITAVDRSRAHPQRVPHPLQRPPRSSTSSGS